MNDGPVGVRFVGARGNPGGSDRAHRRTFTGDDRGADGYSKTGACYVPLVPDFPVERNAFMLADSGAKWLVAGDGLSLPGFAGRR